MDSDSKTVSSEYSSVLEKSFSQSNEKEIPQFMKLFWKEQQKFISSSSPTGIRYHPLIIKFCLNLAVSLDSHSGELIGFVDLGDIMLIIMLDLKMLKS